MNDPPAQPSATSAAPRTLVQLPSGDRTGFQARAVFAGVGIDLAALGATDRTAGAPLVVELVGTLTGGTLAGSRPTGSGLAVLFRYGAVVFFDASPAAALEYLRQIGGCIRQPLPQADRETEVLEIRVEAGAKETIEGNVLVLADVSLEKLQLVADIMAKSVSLAHHERGIDRQFERIEPFAADLDQWGRGGPAASCSSTSAPRCSRSTASWRGRGWTTRPNCSGTIRSWSGSGPGCGTSSRSASGSPPCTASWRSSPGPPRRRSNCCRTGGPCGSSGRSWG